MAGTLVQRPRHWFDWPDLFGRRLVDVFDWPALSSASQGAAPADEYALRVEEFVDGTQLVVRAEMPGIDPDRDIDVHVRDHTLEIRAERRLAETTEQEGRRHSEFRYGSFFRAVPLPPDASDQDVKATYVDGILEVRMPLDSKQAEVTRIEVQRH